MAELDVFFGGGLGARGEDAGGVGEVDAGVPEAVAELPEVELDGVGERTKLTQVGESKSEIGGEGIREGGLRGEAFGLLD